MKYIKTLIWNLVAWSLLSTAHTRAVFDEFQSFTQPEEKIRLTRRILEPPSEVFLQKEASENTRDEIQHRSSPGGSLILQENGSGRQASFIQQESGIQYKVQDNQ
ncbi:hypothetical protein SK128_001146, partial [Halocaridina rubra]